MDPHRRRRRSDRSGSHLLRPAIYNIVDDDPSPVRHGCPHLPRFVGAPAPPHITEDQARATVGEEPIYYQTRLRGASNKKAKRLLNFRPRRLEWLSN